ncbi:unnamed protein product [Natator depressus]
MLTVRAKGSVEIQFNGASSLFVRVGPEYQKQLCGMCGNFNGNPMDDKVLPSGERARNNTQFGNAWISDTSPPGYVYPLATFFYRKGKYQHPDRDLKGSWRGWKI